eukprot:SAG31_NODE_2946_length_4874_cov_1.638534_3_plen_181_part_00
MDICDVVLALLNELSGALPCVTAISFCCCPLKWTEDKACFCCHEAKLTTCKGPSPLWWTQDGSNNGHCRSQVSVTIVAGTTNKSSRRSGSTNHTSRSPYRILFVFPKVREFYHGSRPLAWPCNTPSHAAVFAPVLCKQSKQSARWKNARQRQLQLQKPHFVATTGALGAASPACAWIYSR